jgi:hypothetical protein
VVGDERLYNMRTYEACSSGDNYLCHGYCLLLIVIKAILFVYPLETILHTK